MITLTPVRTDGQHWVRIEMDQQPMEQQGPFDADEVEAATMRLAAICRAMHSEVRIAPTLAKAADLKRRSR